MEKNIWTLPFGSEFPPSSWDVIENSIRPFSIGLQGFFKGSWKIGNLSLWRKIFEHCHLVQNFPRFYSCCYRKFKPPSVRWSVLQSVMSVMSVRQSCQSVSPSVRQSVVRQSVSPSVRQSFSPSCQSVTPSIGICNPFLGFQGMCHLMK